MSVRIMVVRYGMSRSHIVRFMRDTGPDCRGFVSHLAAPAEAALAWSRLCRAGWPGARGVLAIASLVVER